MGKIWKKLSEIFSVFKVLISRFWKSAPIFITIRGKDKMWTVTKEALNY